jgi:outer membrane protein assembly factor BamB
MIRRQRAGTPVRALARTPTALAHSLGGERSEAMSGRALIGPVGCLIAAVCLLASASAAGQGHRAAATHRADWPQWRGPNRDGISPETGLLTEWPAGGPETLWRIPVGEGFSSVSVSAGRAYTLWEEDGGQFLVCLDASTGAERWRHRIDVSFASTWGNGPRSTPAVDDGAVYALSARGRLHAVDAENGRPLWSKEPSTIPA